MRLQVVASVGAAGYFLLNYENAEGKEHVFSGVCSSPSVCPSTCLLSSPSHLPADSTLPTLARAVMASRFNESIDDVWILSSDCRLDDALPKNGSKQCFFPESTMPLCRIQPHGVRGASRPNTEVESGMLEDATSRCTPTMGRRYKRWRQLFVAEFIDCL